MKGFFLPKEVSEGLIDVTADAVKAKKLNLGLFFDKYVLWWKEKGELKCNPQVQMALLKNPQGVKRLLNDPNIEGKKFREEITNRVVRFSLPFGFFPTNWYKFYEKRLKYLFNTLDQMGYYPESKELSLNWRLIINLGAASVYETSLLFHRNYSIPYIPGSAVKGVTRHWTIQKFAEEYQKSKNIKYEDAIKKVDKALENGEDLKLEVDGLKFEELIEIFGTQNKKGEVIFFDALPVLDENQNKDLIVLDVMNVHYKPYYEASEIELKKNKEKAPGDWHSPVPIFFLAVEKGTKFRFCVASKNQELAEKAMELLKEAVKNIGIGAKTSAGYGYFEV